MRATEPVWKVEQIRFSFHHVAAEGGRVEGHTKVPSACIMAGSAGLQTHPRSWVRPYATATAALVVSLSSTIFTHMVSRPWVPMQLLPRSLLLSHSVRTLRESEDLQLWGTLGSSKGNISDL